MKYIKTTLCVFVILMQSCGQVINGLPVAQTENARLIFSNSVTQFKVNVFYETGADPYTGILTLANNTWDVTRVSYEQLFSTHASRTVSVPTTLGAMTLIADQAKATWTSSELTTLARTFAPDINTGTTINMSVIFLNGTFEGNSTVLGVHVSGYPYAFIFKDVVVSVGGGATAQRYTEQATVVHELGHAVGLVNSGVPMVVNHEDLGHIRHSTNTNCVMYWKATSTADVLTFLANPILNNSLNLFGAESLQDGRAYHP